MHTLISPIFSYKLCSAATAGYPKPSYLNGEKLADYFAWLSMIVEEEESKEEEDAAEAEQSARNTHRCLTL